MDAGAIKIPPERVQVSLGSPSLWKFVRHRSPGEIVFQQGVYPDATYRGCQDAHIINFKADHNVGGCEHLEEGDWYGGKEISAASNSRDRKKIFIQFDLSSVPSTFSLQTAQLHLLAFGERKKQHRNLHTVYVARVLRLWAQGGGIGGRQGSVTRRPGDGAPANLGNVTHRSAQHLLQRWEIPGAMGTTDVADWEDELRVGENWPEWVVFDVTQSVSDFLTTPSLNHGWKISQDPERGVDDQTLEYVLGAYMYKSSEAPEAQLRPMLVLLPEGFTSGTSTPLSP
jgi:hypothetical protein